MPTYEYECRSCRHRFERSQSMTAKPAAACPKCKKPARRLISAGGGLLFKGSGFYATDYRSSSYRKGASKESPPKADLPRAEKSSSSCTGEPKSCSGPCSTGQPKKSS